MATREIFTISLEGLKGFPNSGHLKPGIREEILAAIAACPGIQIAQLAQQMDCNIDDLKTAIKLLSGRQSGQIKPVWFRNPEADQGLYLKP